MNSEEYWKLRGEQNAIKENDYAMKQAALITRWFERAKKEMQKIINEFYIKYGDGENISAKQAKVILNDPNILRTTLDEYYQLIENSADYEGAKKALDKLSSKKSINRLELLRLQLDMILDEAYIKYEDITLTSLSQAFDEAYYKMMYDQQQFQGYGNNFNRLSVNQILAAVSTNWSGKNYSERIHDNRISLARRMNRIITTGVITGRSNKQMRQQLEKETDLSSYHARRLVRTEASYVTGQAKMLAYKENDTKKYRFLAVLDLKTSEICRSLDSKVFLVKDAHPGVNCNPMHPHCRSATVPAMEHDPDDTRKARDENGNTYTVPADMTYKEWYDKYVRNNPEALLQEKCLKNIYADNVQYNKYKTMLGKDMPKTLEDFQRLKYNTDNKEYERLKWDYGFCNRYKARSAAELVPYNSNPKNITEKLLGYSLNIEHPSGKNKARVFKSALGYDVSNAEILEQELKNGLKTFRASAVQKTEYGTKYTVQMLVNGTNGNKQPVTTAWMIDEGENKIRMVTAYVKDNTRI